MKVIRCLSRKIREELQDADAYISLAMEWKSEAPEVANLFAELSAEEMGHMIRLHEKAKDLIEEYKQEHGDPPKVMMELYREMHDQDMEDAMRIRVKQGMYKAE